jgi:hypothetical protein
MMIFTCVAGDWKPQRTSRVLKHGRELGNSQPVPDKESSHAVKEKKSFQLNADPEC